jgi:hypothetical protein
VSADAQTRSIVLARIEQYVLDGATKISPRSVALAESVPLVDAQEVLDSLVALGSVRPRVEVWCPHCIEAGVEPGVAAAYSSSDYILAMDDAVACTDHEDLDEERAVRDAPAAYYYSVEPAYQRKLNDARAEGNRGRVLLPRWVPAPRLA